MIQVVHQRSDLIRSSPRQTINSSPLYSGVAKVTNTRRLFFLAILVSVLFLSIDGAHAQSVQPRSYLFVEVRDESGQAIGDATVKVSNANGKELINQRTYKEGVLSANFDRQNDHHYELQITKPGYLPYEQVVFPKVPYGIQVAVTEDFPGTRGFSDFANDSPIKIALLKDPATLEERRIIAAEDQKRQLLLAIKRGDTASVSKLLQAGAKANTADHKGVPAIAWAAFAGDPETIKLLLAAGADVRNQNSSAHEALLLYLAEGTARGTYTRRTENIAQTEWAAIETDIVHRLIEAGSDVNANDAYRGTVLNRAIAQVFDPIWVETIKELIAAKANVNAADAGGETPLIMAAGNSEGELINLLLNAGAKASVNAKDKMGRTALIYAAGAYRPSSFATINTLIANGAKVNESDEAGVTALMLVAKAVMTEAIQTFLRAGALINATDKQGQTALLYAVTGFGQSQTAVASAVKTLLAAGAKINAADVNGQSALMFASAGYLNSTLGLVEFLIANGADVNQVDATGQTALMLAAKTNSTEVVNALLKGGANASINAKSKKGETALLNAVMEYGSSSGVITKALIAAGANVDDVNGDGQTPLILAAQRNNLEVINLLLEAHASINLSDKTGQTALMYVRPDGIGPSSEVVKALLAAGSAVNDTDEIGQTPLMIAAGKEYNLPIVQSLLATDAKASINARDRSGMTALMHAACYAPDMVEPLLAAGANVNDAETNGRTPLMCAVNHWRESALKAVKDLIAAGANVNAKDAKGRTALQYPSRMRDSGLEIVKTLIAAGADVNLADETGQTPLMFFAEWYAVELIQTMAHAGALLDAKDKKGKTALMYSLSGNWTLTAPVVKALIAAGVNVNATDSDGVTPLMLGARAGSLEVVKALLGAGAVVKAKDKLGQTALAYALNDSNYRDSTSSVVNELIAAKADVNATDQYGQTPLMLAAKSGDGNIAQSLLAAGAAVNAKNNLGQTALLFATDESRDKTVNVVRLLIAAKANVNEVNERRQTALMLAAIRGSVESVKLLLEQGVPVNVKDSDGITPLMYAAWGSGDATLDIVKLLLAARARVNEVDKAGGNVLMYTEWGDLPEVLKVLLAAHAPVNARDKKGKTVLTRAVEGNSSRRVERIKLLLLSDADVNIKDNEGNTPLTLARKLGQDAIIKMLEESQRRR
jgi:ankyrin repeat protein